VSDITNKNIIEKLLSHDKALTIKELAPILGVSTRTLQRKADKREIPYVRFAGIKFDPVQVARWWQTKYISPKS
jgi:excisionase family DNA binding protein